VEEFHGLTKEVKRGEARPSATRLEVRGELGISATEVHGTRHANCAVQLSSVY
jgi:hypothetical protein